MSDKKMDSEKLFEGKINPPMAIDVHEYRNDPLAVKKIESVRRTIEKYGLPKELLEN